MTTYDIYLQTAHSPPDGAKDVRLGSGGAISSVSVSESGTGAETISLASSTAASETGSGTETASGVNSVSSAESGAGVDSATMANALGVTETGAGVDAASLSITFTISETGAGTEVPSLAVSVSISETGSGIESTVTIQFQVSSAETGVGTETSISLAMTVTVAETGAGVDVASLVNSFTVTESGAASETASSIFYVTSQDQGVAVEALSFSFAVLAIEETLGAELVWRIKPAAPMIDDFAFPHVLAMRMVDVAQISDKKILQDLPKRKMVGKPGRAVEIEGWSDAQADFDAMEALADGTTRTFYHPSGDSFAVLVSAYNQADQADEYGHRRYDITLMETHG
jgi:hypothetical protein